jgi:hypothetical protein
MPLSRIWRVSIGHCCIIYRFQGCIKLYGKDQQAIGLMVGGKELKKA